MRFTKKWRDKISAGVKKHFDGRRKSGNTELVPLEKRFFDSFEKRGPNDCWEWNKATQNGYGQMQITKVLCGVSTRKQVCASRVSFAIANKIDPLEIPKELMVCHSCDNPPCVNPAHLFLGTCKENIQDSISKGRHNKDRRGEKNGRSKLTDEKVKQIRTDYIPFKKTAKQLAMIFDVHPSTIYRTIRGSAWKNV